VLVEEAVVDLASYRAKRERQQKPYKPKDILVDPATGMIVRPEDWVYLRLTSQEQEEAFADTGDLDDASRRGARFFTIGPDEEAKWE